jgi:hypothetical protein
VVRRRRAADVRNLLNPNYEAHVFENYVDSKKLKI